MPNPLTRPESAVLMRSARIVHKWAQRGDRPEFNRGRAVAYADAVHTFGAPGTGRIGMKMRERVHRDMNPSSSTVKIRGANPAVLPSSIAHESGFRAALAMYRKMHGHDPVQVVRVKLEPGQPRFMVAYGKSPQALYDATTRSTKGKRYHKFGENGGKQPWLVTAPGRPKFLAYVGGSFKAKDWIYR